MLDVPIGEGNSDSQDLNRTIETLVRRHGLSLAEAMEMVVPPIVNEIAGAARGAPLLLHVPAPDDGARIAQGPVALIARHMDECVFSADAMGLRPLWQIETEARLHLQLGAGRRLGGEMTSEPKPMAPGEKFLVLIDRERKRSTLHPHAEMLRSASARAGCSGPGWTSRAV